MASANLLGFSMLELRNGGAITANSMVKHDTTANYAVACTTRTELPIGVCVDTGSSTANAEQVRIQTHGIAKVRAGATITVGQELMVKDGGTGELTPVTADSTYVTCAKALEAGATGEIIAVLLLTPVGAGPANT